MRSAWNFNCRVRLFHSFSCFYLFYFFHIFEIRYNNNKALKAQSCLCTLLYIHVFRRFWLQIIILGYILMKFFEGWLPSPLIFTLVQSFVLRSIEQGRLFSVPRMQAPRKKMLKIDPWIRLHRWQPLSYHGISTTIHEWSMFIVTDNSIPWSYAQSSIPHCSSERIQ